MTYTLLPHKQDKTPKILLISNSTISSSSNGGASNDDSLRGRPRRTGGVGAAVGRHSNAVRRQGREREPSGVRIRRRFAPEV